MIMHEETGAMKSLIASRAVPQTDSHNVGNTMITKSSKFASLPSNLSRHSITRKLLVLQVHCHAGDHILSPLALETD